MDNLTVNETSIKVIIIDENTGRAVSVSTQLSEEDILKLLHYSASFSPPSVSLAAASFVPAGEEKFGMPPPVRVYEEHVFMRKGCGYKKVAVKDISYLKAENNYCDVYLQDGSCMNVTMPMNQVCESLSPRLFKRVHRSFVVNLGYIDTYVGNCLTLSGGQEIIIGREYRKNMREEFVCISPRNRGKEKKT